jgi:squalene-associated FAD-dependent desaturase
VTARRPRIVVVGGGLAGIAAALACTDAGAAVTLVEAHRWLGGATASFSRDGLVIDTGQHVFLRCCTVYRAFLDRLGVTGRTTMQRRMDIPVLSPSRRWRRPPHLRRSALPAPLHLGRALATYPFLSVPERVRAIRASLAMRLVDPLDPAADQRTFGEWLAEHGQGPASVRYLWDLFGLPSLNLPASEASLALAAKVFRTGLLERNDAADIGVPDVPLLQLHGDAGARALERAGAVVHPGVRARGVLTSAGAVTGVALDGEMVEADAVIVAVPNDRVAELLPDGAVADPGAPARLGVSPIVNVHVVYEGRVTDLRFAAAVDSPVQWVFDRTGAGGVSGGAQYLAVSLSGADGYIERSVEDLRGEFLPALERLFPEARGATVELFLVTRERTATFRQGPGTAKLRLGPATRLRGLFLAGAWTDTGWPATMEGAVRSGVTAARRALLSVGSTERLPAEVAA